MDQSQATSNEEEFALFLQGFNQTELYQMCRRSGVPVHPSMSSEQLIQALHGLIQASGNPVDDLRDGLIAVIGAHWMALQAQLKCPAKNLRSLDPEKVNPKPCYGCLDMQVIACCVELPPPLQEKLSQIRRK